MRRRRLLAWVAGAAVLAGGVLTATLDHSGRHGSDRARAASLGHATGLRLQSTINNRLALTGGLAAFARSQGDRLDQAGFEEYAADLAASFERYRGADWVDPSIRSLQIAPDGIVTYVWPLETNEAAIGHDIINDPARGEAVLRAIEDGSFVLAGPFELVQGGLGLVGRSPIFGVDDSDDVFWGFATIVLNVDEVLELTGIDSDRMDGYRIALRGRDGLGERGETFFGDDALFADDAVLVTVVLPQGSWQLAIAPEEGWVGFGGYGMTRAILAVAVVLAGAISALLRWWLEAQMRAQQSSDDLAVMIESIDGPIISADADLVVTHWNHRAATLTDTPADEALGRPLADAAEPFSPRHGDVDLARIAGATMRDQVARTVETDLVGQGGRVGVDFAIAARSDGGVVLVGLDATTRHANDRMRADLAALEHTSKLKDDFLAATSHEMRTPLTSILGLAEMLADGSLGPLSESQQRAADTIDRTGGHLLGVVNQVLDVASIAANGLELTVEPVDLAQLARSAVDIVEPLAAGKSMTLQTSLPDELVVHGDRTRLGEVVLNLLSNAVKFSPEGSDVGLEVRADGTTVEIAVWDNGPGIPADQQHLLFRPFVRLGRTDETSGTGLGLSIARDIVRLHGGSLTVESEPDVLTRFVATLPVDATAAQP